MDQAHQQDKKMQYEMLLRAKAGNQEAFEALLEQYRPLIVSLVTAATRELPFSSADYDDLWQEASILFYHALEKYDVDQDSVAFGLFAKICIRNGLITQAKKLQSRLQVLPFEDSENTEQSAEQGSEDPVDRIAEAESYDRLCACVSSTLTAYENRVWWLYLSGRTAKEIAKILDKDEKSVQNAVFRIRKKLRTVIPRP